MQGAYLPSSFGCSLERLLAPDMGRAPARAALARARAAVEAAAGAVDACDATAGTGVDKDGRLARGAPPPLHVPKELWRMVDRLLLPASPSPGGGSAFRPI